ncbi:MAG TPA: 4-hydroxy-tetrahydrodipicolinate reductase [Bacteroidales bacterium]|nr:4-hydroxy-tetrahydrodipicolinate reductase [Bacteroidales bacterium]
MKILISGYGRMGKEVERSALESGHQIIGIYDNAKDWDDKAELIPQCDVVIDFSLPAEAPRNIIRSIDNHKPIVCGTTGWYDQLSFISNYVGQKHGALFYAPNFNLGVNIFMNLSEILADIMKDYPQYEPAITEIHHTRKLDAPSGTAIALAERLIKNLPQKYEWTKCEEGEQALPHQIPVTSIREDDITGIHTLEFRSKDDRITLTHEAFDRSGFAIGAIMAAQWLLGRKGIFNMNDLLKNHPTITDIA